jgi:hypothetical protein
VTTGEFRGVDQDLLADYLGGALDGTPEQTAVARLIDEDPTWAGAHAALAPAVAQVGADLAAWGEAATEMPLTVADRITAALAGAGPAEHSTGPAEHLTGPAQHLTGSAEQAAGSVGQRVGGADQASGAAVPAQPVGGSGRTPGGLRPAKGRDDDGGPGRRRRRWTRLSGPVALAAASLAAVGLGVNHLATSRSADIASGTALSQPAEDRAAGLPFRTTGTPLRSGTDYTPEALAGRADASAGPKITVSGPGPAPGTGTDGQRMPFAGGLDRLTDQTALTACLGEISAEHARGLLTVEQVDYAGFQGQPALVVRFLDPTGERWAWVSGPECGVPGSGADTRYRTRVG